MASLFTSPKTPNIPAPIPPPTIDQASVSAEQNDLLRQRRGRLSTLISPDVSDAGANVGTKQLLGQ
jgi:hypothetical protein